MFTEKHREVSEVDGRVCDVHNTELAAMYEISCCMVYQISHFQI